MFSNPPIDAVKILFLLIIFANGLAKANSFNFAAPNSHQNQIELRLHKLNALFHRAALMALLKAKAKEKLRKLPKMERIIFSECLASKEDGGGNSPVKMAKCLVKLFDANEAQKLAKNVGQNLGGMSLFELATNWIGDLAKAFKKNGDGQKMEKINSIDGSNQYKKKFQFVKYFTNEVKIGENNYKAKMRRKRGENLETEELKNIKLLKKLENYLEKRDWASGYLQEISKKNIDIVRQQIPNLFGPSVEFGTHRSAFDLAKQIHSILLHTFKGPKSISLLSPRLLSLFSPKNGQNGGKLLSPDLLSFHQNGLFPLPKIFKDISVGEMETLKWMDLLLEMTGSGKELEKLVENLQEEMDNFEGKIMPALKKLRKMDKELEAMKSKLNRRQRRELKMRGYTLVEGEGGEGEALLEEKIRKLAELPENATFSFQNDGGSVIIGGQTGGGATVPEVGGESPDEEDGQFPRTVLLTPAAFVHRVDGVIIEGVYLSPHAFATEMLSPEFFTIHVLSPAAFVAVVLSPMAVASRILGPWAFRAELLSPEAFTAYILNPDVFMAEVLSPKAFEPRVLSPKSMFMQILTPSLPKIIQIFAFSVAASPRVGSPESMGILVLSPNFLSPRINSTESLMIEVLSPHILGGEHEHHEDDREEAGGAVHIIGSGVIRHGNKHHGGEHEGGHGEENERHNGQESHQNEGHGENGQQQQGHGHNEGQNGGNHEGGESRRENTQK